MDGERVGCEVLIFVGFGVADGRGIQNRIGVSAAKLWHDWLLINFKTEARPGSPHIGVMRWGGL